eukprot:TRINITY_DN4740_c0_g1_i1.p1 TRINITY_DN4740_c0_g1~~TRINITY_DN4740_c0_g1_i1.p1  ORF type:complete len:223 (+),score=49.64 TRINITY_DN4740_c0_g1_i1:118-786(+)
MAFEEASAATKSGETIQDATAVAPIDNNEKSVYDGVVSGKYNWNGDIENTSVEVDGGCEITQYSWADGKTVTIYVELEGLDDVSADQIAVTTGKTEFNLTFAAVGKPPKKRVLKLQSLFGEITGAKATQKKGKNMVSLKLTKKEAAVWPKLVNVTSSGRRGEDDEQEEGPANGGMAGMEGMDWATVMAQMGGGVSGSTDGMGGIGDTEDVDYMGERDNEEES